MLFAFLDGRDTTPGDHLPQAKKLVLEKKCVANEASVKPIHSSSNNSDREKTTTRNTLSKHFLERPDAGVELAC